MKINPKVSPPAFVGKNTSPTSNHSQKVCEKLLMTWKSVRYLNANNQRDPRFVGWIVKKIQKAHSKATMMTYLPPILTPITEYPTIIEMFYVSRQLAKQSNMTYIHITLDVGAAIKAFHVIWNNPVAWSDIVIQLGDFHAMMAYFGVIGLYVSGSGFEEVLFQADLCSSGSIRGVISGKHYNRCWKIHETFAEVLERLFLEKFMPDIPDDIKELAASHLQVSDVLRVINESGVADYYQRYQTQFRKCLNGEFGKTAQYWATYMKMVDHLHMLHYAVNTNNCDLRIIIWKELLPLFFATNRIHYARYGTYYIQSLGHIESTHPGAREEIEDVGLSIRRNKLGIGQSIDLAGEQSFREHAISKNFRYKKSISKT